MTSQNPLSNHGLLEVEWYHYKEQHTERARRNHLSKSEVLAEDDTILCFTQCIEKGYPCTWLYINHSQFKTEATLTAKELWLFKLFVKDDGKTFRSIIGLLNEKLKFVAKGVWKASEPSQTVTKLFYASLQNLIERAMHQNSFLRMGDCFIKRPMTALGSKKKGVLSCSFKFFMSGPLLCMHIIVERKRLRSLLQSDMSLAQQGTKVHVITSPNSVVGTLTGGKVEDSSRVPMVESQWEKILHIPKPPVIKIPFAGGGVLTPSYPFDVFRIDPQTLSSDTVVKVSFGDRLPLYFPLQCLYRYEPAELPPMDFLAHKFRQEIGLENKDTSAYSLLLGQHQKSVQVDFWTMPFPSIFPRDNIEPSQPAIASSPATTVLSTPIGSPLPSPAGAAGSPSPTQSPAPSSPQVAPPDQKVVSIAEKAPSEGSDTSSLPNDANAEAKKKRAGSKRKPKGENTSEPKPKKPRKKNQEDAADKAPAPPQEEKKKKAAAKPRRKSAKKQDEGSVATPTDNLSTSTTSTASVGNVTTPIATANSLPPSLEQSFMDPWGGKMDDFGDAEMEDLGGEIDLDSWANSYTTVALPPNANMIRDATPPRTELVSSGNMFNNFGSFALPAALPLASTASSSGSSGNSGNSGNNSNTVTNSKLNSSLNDLDMATLYSSTPIDILLESTPTLQPETPQSPAPILSRTPALPALVTSANNLPTYTPVEPSSRPPTPRRSPFICPPAYQPIDESLLPNYKTKFNYSYTPSTPMPPPKDVVSYSPEFTVKTESTPETITTNQDPASVPHPETSNSLPPQLDSASSSSDEESEDDDPPIKQEEKVPISSTTASSDTVDVKICPEYKPEPYP